MLKSIWMLDHLLIGCGWTGTQGRIPWWRQQAPGWVSTSRSLRQEWISPSSSSNNGPHKRCFGCELLLAAAMLGGQLPRSLNNRPTNTNTWTTNAKGEAGSIYVLARFLLHFLFREVESTSKRFNKLLVWTFIWLPLKILFAFYLAVRKRDSEKEMNEIVTA